MYIARAGEPAKAMAEAAPGLYRLLLDKWRIDELYEVTVAAVDALADTFAAFDVGVVDGILARLSALIVTGLGTVLRAFQTGVVHVYSAFMVIGLAAVGWFFIVPHPEATITSSGDGDYVVQASPGHGLLVPLGRERWTETPTPLTYGGQESVKVHLDGWRKIAEGRPGSHERLRFPGHEGDLGHPPRGPSGHRDQSKTGR